MSGTTLSPSSGSIWPSLGLMLTGRIFGQLGPGPAPGPKLDRPPSMIRPAPFSTALARARICEPGQVVGGQAAEDVDVVLARGEVGVVEQALLAPGRLADHPEVGVDLAGGVEAPGQELGLPREVGPLDVEDLQAPLEDVEVGADLVVGRHLLAGLAA